MGSGKIKFFEVLSQSGESKARRGRIVTDHSVIETPVFMPVGTLGTVKAVNNAELESMDARIILGNTYHLYLRPGNDIMRKAGGLHRFMNWKSSILTDSGGFQVFSLSSLKKVMDEGVRFSSHVDGSKHVFTPESVIGTQRIIGSDIMMPLDECIAYPAAHKQAEKALERTAGWEKKCLGELKNTEPLYGHNQHLFCIVQGSTFNDLRKRSIEELCGLDYSGCAIGGLAVGEENEMMYDVTDFCTDIMPLEKPRYLMGVGTPVDILESVERGVDMFDCVMPTRNARHGRIFTTYGEINIKNAKYADNFDLIDDKCLTYTSRNFSFAYLRHLFMTREILGAQLASIHNIGFYLKLMRDIREAISNNSFKEFKKTFLSNYNSKK
ncbi:MAG: tRNA guanosine(34) transglycosylase Tgt [Bacteroidetes bacterium]|nr:tRNA guanosine(34) transglycosylase Tgt [Bacteroidota bacterium]